MKQSDVTMISSNLGNEESSEEKRLGLRFAVEIGIRDTIQNAICTDYDDKSGELLQLLYTLAPNKNDRSKSFTRHLAEGAEILSAYLDSVLSATNNNPEMMEASS